MNHRKMDQDIKFTWIESFNPREIEILQLISDGLSNIIIADKLHLSPETIKWYNKQIFIKLGVNNRTQAAKKAVELNLFESELFAPDQEKFSLTGNLPAQLSTYVGRKKEIAETIELLKDNRLVILTGAGGSGKTRLALQVAEELQNTYSDGVWLVELANVLESSMVLQTIANVLDISDRAESDIGDVLKRTLSRKHILLLIDNMEHLLDSAPLLANLLASSPHLTILGTSRERLHISGEQEYPILPLQVPDLSQGGTSKRLKEVDSVALFIKRARAVQPGLVLDDETLRYIARICLRLDGLPLAIELCAPMVKVFSLSVIAERIEKNLDFIPSGPRDLPARQQTLIKTLQWSRDLLNKEEKVLFDRLAIFNGGGTLEAIDSICGKEIVGDTGKLLSALVNKNLVLAQERLDGQIHFSLLETIRRFNQVQLKTKGEFELISQQHAEYFTLLVERAHAEFSTPKFKYWFLHLKVEQDNIRSAMQWTIINNSPEIGLRLAASSFEFWHYYGYPREGLRWIQAHEIPENISPSLHAAVLFATGVLFTNINEFEPAKPLLNRSLEIYTKIKDKRGTAWALLFIGFANIGNAENISNGIELCNKGLDIFIDLNDLGGMAHAQNILGELYRVQGDLLNAKKSYQICLEMTQESGEKIREAIQYANLGVIAYEEKEYHLAEKLIKQGLAIFLELDGRLGMSYHLAGLAGPTLALGKPLRAARILGASAAGLQSMKNTFQLADQSLMDQFSKETNAALDEESFKKAFEEGQRMTIYEAVAYALSDEDVAE